MLTQLVIEADRLFADDPGVRPNTDGLPGLTQIKGIVGAFLVWGLVAAVAAVAIGAAVMAFGKITSRPGYSETGKSTVLWAAIAALVIGASNAIVTFFSGVGEEVRGAPSPAVHATIDVVSPEADLPTLDGEWERW